MSCFPQIFGRRLLVVCFVGYSLLAGGFVHAQTDTVVPFSSIAKQIPESNTEIIAFNDLAGHLEAALNNRALERVLSEGSLAEFAKAAGRGGIDIQDGQDLSESGHRRVEKQLLAVSNGMAEVAEIMNHLQWKSSQNENVRESRYEFDFQDK